MRKFFGDIVWEKKAIVFFVVVLLFTVVGPFGTYQDLVLAKRFVYWSVLVMGIGFVMHICMHTALHTPYLGKTNRYVRLLIGSMIAAVPSTSIVLFAHEVMRPQDIDVFDLLRIWAQISIIGTGVGLLEYMEWGNPAPPVPEPRTTPFHARLSPKMGKDIISLTIQDHYVAATTTEGSELILMRFADAIRELGDLPGGQIHRSHWVAYDHVQAVTKDGARHLAQLSDGRALPVSATYIDTLRKAVATAA